MLAAMSNYSQHLGKLQDYYAAHGVVPAYSTLMQVVGFRSKSPVAALVNRLKLEGYLESAPDKRLRPGKRFFERPIHESVQAGFPSPATDAQHDTLTIDEFLVEHPSQTVLVTVKGDSMSGAGIHAGDIVVVEKRPAAKVGDIVIAIVDNEFTLKYLDKEKDQFVLRPANLAYPVIRPRGDLEIFGIVVGQFRKYKR
jgi:SOS-response transcriptional repressor LexA